MFFNFLKNLLPIKLKLIFINLYNIFKMDKLFSSPDYFPLNFLLQNKISYIKIKTNKYFFKFYQEKPDKLVINPEQELENKYEILIGKKHNVGLYKIKPKINSVLPISMEKKQNELKIFKNNKKFAELTNLHISRFHYFEIKKNNNYKFLFDKGSILGSPIPIRNRKKTNKKLVLILFLDGLAESCFSPNNMPNTFDFFKNAVRFSNNFSNAEWTLPSVPSFFLGSRQQTHGFFHPRKNHLFSNKFTTIAEYFQKSGYLTSQFNGMWRMSPAYGYVSGFDRTLYKKEFNCNQIINNFFEHFRAFPKRSHFVWMSFLETHHLLNTIPDLSNQLANSFGAHLTTPWYDNSNNNKSVFIGKNDFLKEIYVSEIKRLDFYLSNLYSFIEKNFADKDLHVNLVSDHGHAFLTQEKHPLSDERIRVPWLIRDSKFNKKHTFELTENIDVFSTILSSCGINFNNKNINSNLPLTVGGKKERRYSFSQSIYPGQTYKAVINTKNSKYYFESEKKTSDDGFLDLNIKFDEKLSNITDQIDFSFIKKVQDQMNIWNNALKKKT